MKNKSALLIIILIVLQLSCKKETDKNTFKFTSITGLKSGTTGVVSALWTDDQNSKWEITVQNPNGSIRSSFNTGFAEVNIANLGLDSTYTIGIKGDGKSNQNGSFNARIATTGDVAISNVKP